MPRAVDMIQTLLLEISQTKDVVDSLHDSFSRVPCEIRCGGLGTQETENSDDVRLLLIAYPRDLQILSSNPNLMHAFERHFRGHVQEYDEPFLLKMYALPSAVVLLPETAWQQSLSWLARSDDKSLEKLLKSWNRELVSDEIHRERMQIISRAKMGGSPTDVKKKL